MTFTEYNNQGDNPVYRPFVEVTEEDISEKRKISTGWIIDLEINGKKISYLLKKGSNCLFVPDPDGDSSRDKMSVFNWSGGELC